MSKPTPSPDSQPVLIVSDGEQGDKMIKITPPPGHTPAEQSAPPEPPTEKNNPAADLAPDSAVSTDQND